MKRILLGVLALALAGCGSSPGLSGSSSPLVSTQQAVSFVDLGGKAASLDQFVGHPVVLSFLSPTDADSGAQLPLLIRLAGAYQDEGVVFVCAGEEATLKALKAYARDNALSFPVWQDPKGKELAARGFTRVPAHQFIARDGHVKSAQEGFMSRGELLTGISRILN